MKIFYKNKHITLDAKKSSNIGKIFGLMFRSSKTRSLVFEFEKEVSIYIHSWFVFFPFLALWLDADGKIIDFRLVKPFTFAVKPGKNFKKIIEIPVNPENREIIDFFVGKRKI